MYLIYWNKYRSANSNISVTIYLFIYLNIISVFNLSLRLSCFARLWEGGFVGLSFFKLCRSQGNPHSRRSFVSHQHEPPRTILSSNRRCSSSRKNRTNNNNNSLNPRNTIKAFKLQAYESCYTTGKIAVGEPKYDLHSFLRFNKTHSLGKRIYFLLC